MNLNIEKTYIRTFDIAEVENNQEVDLLIAITESDLHTYHNRVKGNVNHILFDLFNEHMSIVVDEEDEEVTVDNILERWDNLFELIDEYEIDDCAVISIINLETL